jgi:hypothetical protein
MAARQPRLPQGGNGGGDVDVLERVTLDHFTANPQNIGPFGSSTLLWQVVRNQAPPAVQIRIDNVPVADTGSELVQPLFSHTYMIAAIYRGAFRELGTATVNVGLSGCKIKEIPNAVGFITTGIQQAIAQRKDVSLKTPPQVAITPGTIAVHLELRRPTKIDALHLSFDADVMIDLVFGLTVVSAPPPTVFWGRTLAPVNVQINTDVSVPFYLWFIPGAAFGLAIAINLANGDAQKAARELLDGLVNFFNEFPDPQGFGNLEPHSVDFSPDSGGSIDILECPVSVAH